MVKSKGSRVKAKAEVRFRAYTIIEQAVERGISIGWNRAHKHTDKPEKDTAVEQVSMAVMNELGEIMEFGEPDGD